MNQFDRIRVRKPRKSLFNLSHERKLTMDMGMLTPILLSEVLPGDKFRINTEALVRLQPMLAPIMHRVNVYTHYFFVPNRLIWNDWEKFITGGKDGSLEPNHPKFTGLMTDDTEDMIGIGSLVDFMGYPVTTFDRGQAQPFPSFSQLPFRAYQLIYNEYYRDQNLIDPVDIPLGSVDYSLTDSEAVRLLTLRRRAWEKDYFTSCLPTAQRGGDVLLPLQGEAPVTGIAQFSNSDGTAPAGGNTQFQGGSKVLKDFVGDEVQITDGLSADLSEASSTTITELRRAYALQRWMEKMMRGGARYIEQMKVMFGVASSDARLQRPEYLGGGKMPVQISEVLQMSQTDTTAQGTMAGHGYSAGVSVGFSRFFEEHGFVIGIMSIVPRTGYMQGLPRLFSKFDKYDYFWPEFAHIGEQEVLKKELYVTNNPIHDDALLGYQRRYGEYCFMHDMVHGDMRDSLKFWHMAQEYSATPALNQNLVECNPTTRIFPVMSQDPDVQSKYTKCIVQLYHDFKAIRPIPKYGDPI